MLLEWTEMRVNFSFYLMLTIGCIEKDWAHMKAAEASFQAAGKDVKLVQQERALIAVQGPGTAKVCIFILFLLLVVVVTIKGALGMPSFVLRRRLRRWPKRWPRRPRRRRRKILLFLRFTRRLTEKGEIFDSRL